MERQNEIGESLYNFQSALIENGESFESFMTQQYLNKWMDDLYHAMAIRTTFVNTMHNFLTDQGLLEGGIDIEREFFALLMGQELKK
jgi:hypothetical protein